MDLDEMNRGQPLETKRGLFTRNIKIRSDGTKSVRQKKNLFYLFLFYVIRPNFDVSCI
jgi:hypothetical protein